MCQMGPLTHKKISPENAAHMHHAHHLAGVVRIAMPVSDTKKTNKNSTCFCKHASTNSSDTNS